jgi:PTH1 family peptidyl-tRNA hydrolase
MKTENQGEKDLRNYLVAGLGNPGREYRSTRHNVGFLFLDRLAINNNTDFSRMKFESLFTTAPYKENNLILIKPVTFMNLSGKAVKSCSKFFKITNQHIVVAYDDVDLPMGTIRIRPGGSSGGHKGMKSIIDSLRTENVPRIRIGIGRPPGRMEAADYVLQRFSKEEMEILEPVLDTCVKAVYDIIDNGIEFAMNKYNQVPDSG